MTLAEYIKTHYSGDRYAFAKSQGVSYSQVVRWIKCNCYVIDSKACCEISKQIKTEIGG